MGLDFNFTLDTVEHAVSIRARRPTLVVDIDGHGHTAHEYASADGASVLEIDGRRHHVWRVWEGDRLHLRIDGRTFSVGYADAIVAAQQAAGTDDVLRADMPGVVVAVHGGAGAAVSAGDTLLVIESMKMQINIVAPRDGVIDTIRVAVNDAFDKGAVLAALHPKD